MKHRAISAVVLLLLTIQVYGAPAVNEAARAFREAENAPAKLKEVSEEFRNTSWGDRALFKRAQEIEQSLASPADVRAAYEDYIAAYPAGQKVSTAKRILVESLYPRDKAKALDLAKEVANYPKLPANTFPREFCLHLMAQHEYAGRKDYAAARRWLNKYLEDYPNGVYAFSCQSMLNSAARKLLQRLTDGEKLEQLRKIADQNPDAIEGMEAVVRRARILLNEFGKYEQAAEELSNLVAQHPDSPLLIDALLLEGSAYAQIHSDVYDRDKAVAIWKRILLLSGKSKGAKARAHLAIAQAYLEWPLEEDLAMQHLQWVSDLVPKSNLVGRAILARARFYEARFFRHSDRPDLLLAIEEYWKIPSEFPEKTGLVRQALLRIQYLQQRFVLVSDNRREKLLSSEYRKEVLGLLQTILKKLEALESQ